MMPSWLPFALLPALLGGLIGVISLGEMVSSRIGFLKIERLLPADANLSLGALKFGAIDRLLPISIGFSG